MKQEEDGIKEYFFDTYAVIELVSGSSFYARFVNETPTITIFNLAEIYYSAINNLDESKAEEIYNKYSCCVVNRVNKKDEFSATEIEDFLKYPVIAEIPEDVNVQKSLAARSAIVDYIPNSPASVEMRRLAHYLVGKEFRYNQGFWDRLFGWFK